MNPKLIVGLAAFILFISGAVAGSRSAPPIRRMQSDPPPAKPMLEIHHHGPAVAPAPPVEKPPANLTFTEEAGVLAKTRYLEELAAGKLDPESLWIVFRCGGRGLNQFLMERLPVADPKELQAIYTEIDRFLLPSSKSIGLEIDDSVFTLAQSMAAATDSLQRAIAARLIGTRDIDLARNTLWRMTEGEKDSEVQMAILESLAPIADPIPTQESMNRFADVVRAFWGNEKMSPRGGKLERLIAAQTLFKKRCEDEFRRQNPSFGK